MPMMIQTLNLGKRHATETDDKVEMEGDFSKYASQIIIPTIKYKDL
jgi:hypothetical protein